MEERMAVETCERFFPRRHGDWLSVREGGGIVPKDKREVGLRGESARLRLRGRRKSGQIGNGLRQWPAKKECA